MPSADAVVATGTATGLGATVTVGAVQTTAGLAVATATGVAAGVTFSVPSGFASATASAATAGVTVGAVQVATVAPAATADAPNATVTPGEVFVSASAATAFTRVPSILPADRQENPLTADCIACWRLTETGSTDDAVDATGNGHTGVRSGSLPSVPGVFTTARRHVTNVSGYLTVTSPTELKLQTFTIAGWFNMIADPRDDGGSFYFVSYVSGGASHSLKIGDISASTDAVRFGAQLCMDHAGGGTYVGAYSSQNYFSTLDNWRYIVTTWDGTYLTLYIDGRPHQRIKNDTGIGTIPYDSGNIVLNNIANYQDGAMCDWAVYNTCKDEDWVYSQFTGQSLPAEPDGVIPESSSTLLLCRMDEDAAGQCARDAAGSGYYFNLPGGPPHPAPVVTGYEGNARDLTTAGTTFYLHDVPAFHVDELTAISICYPTVGGRVFNKVVSGGYSWQLRLLPSGGKIYPHFAVTLSGGTVTAQSATDISFSDWHWLMGTFDGDYVRVYADGVLLKSTQNTTGTTDIVYDTNNFYIGESLGFGGLIDETSLLDEAMSLEWLQEAMENQPPKVIPTGPYPMQTGVVETSHVTFDLYDPIGFAPGWFIEVQVGAAGSFAVVYEDGGVPEFKPGWQGAASLVTPTATGFSVVLDYEGTFPLDDVVVVRVTAFDDSGLPIIMG